MHKSPVEIGNRLELFVDRLIVEKLENLNFKLHTPCLLPQPQNFIKGHYITVLKDDGIFKAYSRDYIPTYTGPRHDGNPGEILCYSESKDGINWYFPQLKLTDVKSSDGYNVIMANQVPFCHNFTPMIDANKTSTSKFKALSGTHPGGLYAFESSNGIKWNKIIDRPVINVEPFAFDSQNITFWSATENRYVCYFRTWGTKDGYLRTISKSTSDDYINWTDPVLLAPNLPGEHLYTSSTQPYHRAEHIYISLPARFMADRGSSTDILFMATRAGTTHYERLFTEAFIRPGLRPERWGNRANYAALNVVPINDSEMHIYNRNGLQYKLRTDGFISINAGFGKGEFLTKPLIFSGKDLMLNFSTSAAGSIRLELLDEQFKPIRGFELADSPIIVGDQISYKVKFNSEQNFLSLAGRPIRLRFQMTESDLYSIKFD